MMHWTRQALAVAIAAAVACQPADRADDAAVTDTQAAIGARDTGMRPGDRDTVQVTLAEWSVRLARDTLPAGAVTFRAVNQGTFQHALEVEGGGREWETDPINAGGQATLQVDLAPGTYEVYCPIDDAHGNHRQMGMRTTLVVR